MNRSDFEDWLRNEVENTPFQASEAGWMRMQNALKKQPEQKKGLFFWTSPMKMAAGLVVVLTLGTITYFLYPANQSYIPEMASASIGQPIIIENEVTSVAEHQNSSTTTFSPRTTETIVPRQPKVSTISYAAIKQTSIASQETQSTETEAAAVQEVLQPKANLSDAVKHVQTPSVISFDITPKTSFGVNPTYWGVTGSWGTTNLGGPNYTLGITGRKDLSERIFVDATLALARTSVSYSDHHSFTGLYIGQAPNGATPGIATSNEEGFESYTLKEDVQANYAGNIVSVGIAPLLGVKITPRLSLIGGPYAFHNINAGVSLHNAQDISQEAIQYQVIPEKNTVNSWDIGVKSSLEYHIFHAFSIHAGYRYGLSNYMLHNNQSYRNSGVDFGFRYYIKSSKQ